MAISSAGIGSGLDVNSIVTQLMAVEKAPLQQMQKQASSFQSKLSAYGQIQSNVSTLRDAARKLTDIATWGSTKATSGDSSVFTATTDSTVTSAGVGNYSISVSQLATAQTVASPATAFPVGAGKLRLELGSWSAGQTAFTGKSGSAAVDVSIDATDTAAQVRDKINAAKAGVTASVVTDASGSRLVMRSTDTGAENAFRVTEVNADGTTTNAGALSKLTFNPPAGGASTMSQTQTAGNAAATINGLAVSSASNLLTGAIEGVTIKLAQTSSTPVELTVASNTDAMTSAITAFTTAYNGLNSYLGDQTKYDSASKTAGVLQGDSGTNSLRYAMRGTVGDTGTMTGAYHRLSDIGITSKADGTLTVDSTKLTAALTSNRDDVKALFMASNASVPAANGMARRLQQWGDSLLNTDGTITTRSDSLQRQVDANSKKQDDFNTRMTGVEKRMRAQYTALDTKMATLNGLSTYMTQQVTNWNKSTG